MDRKAYYEVESSHHHTNLFVVLIGKSSKARKGVSWNHVQTLFDDIAPEWTANRIQSGLSSGEGLIWAVRDEDTKEEED